MLIIASNNSIILVKRWPSTFVTRDTREAEYNRHAKPWCLIINMRDSI